MLSVVYREIRNERHQACFCPRTCSERARFLTVFVERRVTGSGKMNSGKMNSGKSEIRNSTPEQNLVFVNGPFQPKRNMYHEHVLVQTVVVIIMLLFYHMNMGNRDPNTLFNNR